MFHLKRHEIKLPFSLVILVDFGVNIVIRLHNNLKDNLFIANC